MSSRYSHWLSPEFIVAHTPVRIREPRALPYLLGAPIVLLPSYLIAGVLWRIWHPLALLAIGAAIFGVRKWLPTVVEFIQRARLSLPLEALRASVVKFSAHGDATTQVWGIDPGTWVQLRQDHEDKRKILRNGASRLASEPEVDYRLCVSRFRINGNHHEVAFSDGRKTVWPSAAKAYYCEYRSRRSRLLRYAPSDHVSVTAAILRHLVEEIGSKESLPIEYVLQSSNDSESRQRSNHAVRGAVLWGLVEATLASKDSDLIQLVAKSDFVSLHCDLDVRISQAGRVWLDCSPEALEAARKKAKMDKESQRSIRVTVKGGTNTGWQFGDHSTAYNSTSGADRAEVLAALSEFLDSPDTRWASARDRAIVEAAVAHSDIADKELRPAVKRALDATQDLGIGIAASAIFEMLKFWVLRG